MVFHLKGKKLIYCPGIVVIEQHKELASDLHIPLHSKENIPQNVINIVAKGIEVFMPFEDLVDIKEEIERLEKEKTRLEAEVARGEKMLSNPGFVNKAPEAKINEEKAKLENYKQMLKTVEERLSSMK